MDQTLQVSLSHPEKVLDDLIRFACDNKQARFRDLVILAGLDPKKDFVGASLPALDFRDEDLRDFNFSDADLTGCDFRRANLEGACFNNAELTGVIGIVFQFEYMAEVETQGGLNNRSLKQLVKLAEKFDAEVMVTHQDKIADGSSLVDLMMLCIGPRCAFSINTSGPQAEEALESLLSLIEDT
jgi:phosphotransferase system HPr (HPr) family protein